MHAHAARQIRLALSILVAVAILGGWELALGGGLLTPTAQAKDRSGDSDRDHGKNGKHKHKDFDHFACYEVKCVVYDKGHSKEVDCPAEYEKVTLVNQFTDNDGVKVLVKQLKLLCAPTKKDHKDDHDNDKDYNDKD